MTPWRILHVSDLHIADPVGGNEYLRVGYFEEYIEGLIDKLRHHCDAIDCVVATGDFVNRGKTANFDHAKTILENIAARLNIATDRILVCPGNHDFDQTSGKPDRSAYNSFSRNFANAKPLISNTCGVLIKMSDDLYGLMVDVSKSFSKTNCDPDLDNTMQAVRSTPDDSLLIVGTHQPVEHAPNNSVPFGTGQERVWLEGIPLRQRIRQTCAQRERKALWLAGDVHAPSNTLLSEQIYIVTGRLGGSTGSDDSQIARQAKLVIVGRGSEPIEVIEAELVRITHQSHPHCTEWTATPRKIGAPIPDHTTVPMKPQSRPPSNSAVEYADGRAVDALDAVLESEVRRTIQQERLYQLGRFVTCTGAVSLSWVSIGPLLNLHRRNIVAKMAAWIAPKLSTSERVVLVGVDCWGAVLASNLSVLLGIPSFCVAARARGEHSAHEEKLGFVAKEILKADVIVCVIDVIATGHTIEYLHQGNRSAGDG